MTRKEELVRRAREYAERFGMALGKVLGFGIHGIVLAAQSQTGIESSPLRSAIKAHERQHCYSRERDIYLRLKERNVEEIRGCEVPRLLRHDDQLWVIEMTIVTRPFVLDFAGAYLDWFPDFPDDVLADWRAEKQEQFGQRWPEVQAILGVLQSHGVFMEDVSPSNISVLD